MPSGLLFFFLILMQGKHFDILLRIRDKIVTMSDKPEALNRLPILNAGAKKKRALKKYSLPVIGHFADRSVEFKSILEAEMVTGINYNLIFEACIGKIYKAKNVHWEFKKGNHYIKYKAFYINAQENYTRYSGFNG
jgi:hypothetical protein